MHKLSPPFIPTLLAVFASSYLVNLFWEVCHSVLYDWSVLPLHDTVYFYVPKILGATLGDAVMISAFFAAIALYRGGFYWLRFTRRADYLFLVVAGFVAAIAVELRAAANHSWTYGSYMPLVWGIGLTPLVQLAITALATLWILRHWYAKS
jgi:hypothetical protein